MTNEPNIYEDIARTRKVIELVRVLDDFGVTAETAARLDQPGRDAIAGLAQVHPPSEKTWAIVVGVMARRVEDPFAGMPVS